jgi:hypothetical protein
LDADIKIIDPFLIDKLFETLKEEKAAGVSGISVPIMPVNFVQKVIFHGNKLWEEVRNEYNASDVYYSSGAVRIFSKDLYKKIIFPDLRVDDIFPFLYCKENNLKYSVDKRAKVYYMLPSTYADFFRQMTRYYAAANEVNFNLGKHHIKNNFNISNSTKLMYVAKKIWFSPIMTVMYLLFLVPVILYHVFNFRAIFDLKWKVSKSTKF